MLDFHFAFVSHDHNMAAGASQASHPHKIALSGIAKKKKEVMFPVLSSFLRVKNTFPGFSPADFLSDFIGRILVIYLMPGNPLQTKRMK